MCQVLDDFLMIGQTDEVADTRLATFLGLCDYLCVPVVADKMEKRGLHSLPGHSQLENRTGLLNFACRVVAPGKPLLRRLYSLKEGMEKLQTNYKLRLSAGTQQDLATPIQWYNDVRTQQGPHSPPAWHTGCSQPRRLAGGKRRTFSQWKVDPSTYRRKGSSRGISVRMANCGKSLGETLQDHRLVMEVADETLAQLVNTQNHIDKEVMGIVRACSNTIFSAWQNCLQKQHLQPQCFSHPPRSSSHPEGRPFPANIRYMTPSWTGPGPREESRHNDGQVPGRQLEKNI